MGLQLANGSDQSCGHDFWGISEPTAQHLSGTCRLGDWSTGALQIKAASSWQHRLQRCHLLPINVGATCDVLTPVQQPFRFYPTIFQVLLGQSTGDWGAWRRDTLSMRGTRGRDVLVRLKNPLTFPRWRVWRVTQAEGTAWANPRGHMELDEFSEGLLWRAEWQETRLGSHGGPVSHDKW